MLLTDDVRLRLSSASQEIIQPLTFAVRDLAHARRFLASHDLLDRREDDQVMLSRRVSQGLKFRFVEASN